MLSDILSWIEKYGVEAAILVVIAALFYSLYDKYLSFWFSKKLNSTDKNHGNDKLYIEKRKNDLKNQEFFSNIQFKINIDIHSENFSRDPVRSELFRDITIILLESYYEKMDNFVKVVDHEWDKDEWAKKLNQEIIEVMEKFKEQTVVRKIPETAVTRFILWYSPYMQQTYFYIRKIRGMGNRNAIENTNTFLLLLELILTNVISDMQNYTVFNGHLNGIEYKGNIIGECNSIE